MADLMFLAATAICFTVAVLYVHGCDHLKAKPRHD